MRLIDADELIDAIAGEFKRDEFEGMEHEISARVAAGLVNDAPTAMQWASVEDGLPDNPRSVLCWVDGKGIYLGYYNSLDEYKCFMPWPHVYGDISKVTYWMELPEPPTEVLKCSG